MNLNKKSHQVESGVIIALLLISVFSLGFYTEDDDKITGFAVNEDESQSLSTLQTSSEITDSPSPSQNTNEKELNEYDSMESITGEMVKVTGYSIAEDNKNPLNIKVSKAQHDCKCWEGGVPIPGYNGKDDSNHAKFNSVKNGYAAGIQYIERAKAGNNVNYNPDMTLKEFFVKYVGPGGNMENHITSAKSLGYNPDVVKLKDVNPASLAPGISRAEDIQYHNKLVGQNFFKGYTYVVASTSSGTIPTPNGPTFPTTSAERKQLLEQAGDLKSEGNVLEARLKSASAEAEYNKIEEEAANALAIHNYFKKGGEGETEKGAPQKALDAYKKYGEILPKLKSAEKNKILAAEALNDPSLSYKNAKRYLNSKDKDLQKKALFKLEQIASDSKDSNSGNALTALEGVRNNLAYSIVKEIKKDIDNQKQVEAAKSMGIDIRYDKKTNKFVYDGRQGDFFTIGVGGIVTIQDLPKELAAAASAEQKKSAVEKFKESLPDHLNPNSLKIDEFGNLIDPEGNWITGVKPDLENPGKFVLDSKEPDYIINDKGNKVKKFEEYKVNGKSIYKNEKTELLYDQKNIEIKTGEATIIEVEGLLKKSIKIVDGKLTSDTAKLIIEVDGKDLEIDSSVYNKIKNLKGKGVNKNHEDSTLVISIGSTDYSYVSYKTDNGKPSGLTRTKIREDVYVVGNEIYTAKEVKSMDDDEKKEKNIEKAKQEKRIVRDEAFSYTNKIKLTTTYDTYKGFEIAEVEAVDSKGTMTYYYVEHKGESVEPVLNADGTINVKATQNQYSGAAIQMFTNADSAFEDTEVECLTGNNCDDERGNTKQNQIVSRAFFADVKAILTDFQGLGYYATFFFEDEYLDEWRESVDEAFATMYLGIEYWESGICKEYTDFKATGVAYVDTKLGLAGVGAHIEATRSQAITLPEGVSSGDVDAGLIDVNETLQGQRTEYLYKITFNVKNGDYEADPTALDPMKFNIILKGERTKPLFKDKIVLGKGEQHGAIKESAIVQYSNSRYDKICIKFDLVPSKWILTENDMICNTIEAPAGATSYGAPSSDDNSDDGGGSGNMNDI